MALTSLEQPWRSPPLTHQTVPSHSTLEAVDAKHRA